MHLRIFCSRTGSLKIEKRGEIQITTVIFHACISNFPRFTPLEKPTSQVFFFDTL